VGFINERFATSIKIIDQTIRSCRNEHSTVNSSVTGVVSSIVQQKRDTKPYPRRKAFPSDQYIPITRLHSHGCPEDAIVEIKRREAEYVTFVTYCCKNKYRR
jgi:hypothetical protein